MDKSADQKNHNRLIKIALHGVPRSGTTWLGEIFNSALEVRYCYQPLFSYAFKDFLTDQSTEFEIDCFFECMQKTQDRFVLQTEERARGIVPSFSKTLPTHLVYKEVRYHNILTNLLAQDPDVRAVFLIRDPRAVISSFLNAPREFRRDLNWKVEEEWRFAPKKNQDRPEEFFGFEKWKEASEIFLRLTRQYPDRVLLLRYADLLRATRETVDKLFLFSGLTIGDQTEAFLEGRIAGRADSAYSVFRPISKLDEKWKQSLPDEIDRAIRADLENTPFAQFLD